MNAIARGSFEVLSTLTASLRTTAFVEVLASWMSGAMLTSGDSRPMAVTARLRTPSSGSDRRNLQRFRNRGRAAAKHRVVDRFRADLGVRILRQRAQRSHRGRVARAAERRHELPPRLGFLFRVDQA